MKELEAMLMKQAKRAMAVTATKVEADMYEETGDFYTGGNPKLYVRTGALGDTPRTTAISQSGNVLMFNAYLDQNYQYSTGKSPSMGAVLDVANDHSFASSYVLNPPVGRQHFWERAEKKMEKSFKKTMRCFFR